MFKNEVFLGLIVGPYSLLLEIYNLYQYIKNPRNFTARKSLCRLVFSKCLLPLNVFQLSSVYIFSLTNGHLSRRGPYCNAYTF